MRDRVGTKGHKSIVGRIFRAGRNRRRQEAEIRRLSLLRDELSASLRALYLERIHLLDDLATLYYDLGEDDASLLRKKDLTREEAILSFREKLKALRQKERFLQGIARTVDIMKNGAASLLDRAFPKMRPEERTILLLLYLEAGTDVIAYFTGRSSGTVRSVKSRFLRKAERADLPEAEKEILLTSFQKRG